MKTLTLCAALTAPAVAQISNPSATPASVSGCAAVVSTTAVCTTCVTAACVVQATVTAGCGDCDANPPTVYRGFPCEEGCGNIGCETKYKVVTASDGVCGATTPGPGATPTGEPTGPSSSSSTAGAARMRPFRLW
ncbi:uncharacterized protein C8A04DRAFT_30633 [Dichotomopilus funicola]|uniref:Uncharacterized protein n=1 Tax=Dichotomopilus funicola TaxID=1934379 RepID=A0AAN6ZL16_9PEZI|nr:hypothetical protein C8A04DRAFT_30633 [Dichotomopilus funicola]